MPAIEPAILIFGLLLLIGIFASRVSERLSVPSLLLFLGVGMLAGSEGIGGIAFESPQVAYAVGTVALLIILFAGGLETKWEDVRPVLLPGLLLSTGGVLTTALLLGTFGWFVLGSYSTFDLGPQGLSWLEALLLAAIVSSTDAAAVFAVFRSSPVQPSRRLRNLLEFESGSNDPMAVLLTTVILQTMTQGAGSWRQIGLTLMLQLILGVLVGVIMGWGGAWLVDRMSHTTKGLVPVLALALASISFGLAHVVGGNGFLAVYVAGLVMGTRTQKAWDAVVSFHNGLSWLMQIVMFIMLGLLVFPSGLLPVAGVSIVMAIFLMVVARPLSVWLLMKPFKMKHNEMSYLSWVGLRGSVPIVLATFPGTYGIEGAETIFNVVFFIVIVSVLVQGATLVPFARWLKVTE